MICFEPTIEKGDKNQVTFLQHRAQFLFVP